MTHDTGQDGEESILTGDLVSTNGQDFLWVLVGTGIERRGEEE